MRFMAFLEKAQGRIAAGMKSILKRLAVGLDFTATAPPATVSNIE
jgi:hypothetical protein